jgi:hypothetical protein
MKMRSLFDPRQPSPPASIDSFSDALAFPQHPERRVAKSKEGRRSDRIREWRLFGGGKSKARSSSHDRAFVLKRISCSHPQRPIPPLIAVDAIISTGQTLRENRRRISSGNR